MNELIKELSPTDRLVLDAAKRVKHVIDEGSVLNIANYNQIPLTRLQRSVDESFRMANIYEQEKSYKAALLLYTRYASMALEYLPKHPQYATRTRESILTTRKKVESSLQRIELLKKLLRDQYEIDAVSLTQQLERELERRRQEAERSAAAAEAARIHQQNIDSFDPMIGSQHDVQPQLPISHTNSIEYPEFGDDSTRPMPPPSYTSATVNHIPSVDRSNKPSAPAIELQLTGIRTVVVPQTLVDSFMAAAAANTSNNVETCGILCAKLVRDSFHVSHCVVPQQSGTPDSCLTQNEQQVFEFQDAHDLITVGWIHVRYCT